MALSHKEELEAVTLSNDHVRLFILYVVCAGFCTTKSMLKALLTRSCTDEIFDDLVSRDFLVEKNDTLSVTEKSKFALGDLAGKIITTLNDWTTAVSENGRNTHVQYT